MRFDRRTSDGFVPIMRSAPTESRDVLEAGCFPLVPYANRIRDGRFTCEKRTIVLARNSPPDPSPMHGQGWRAAWQVVASGAASAELAFMHEAGEWPWTYEARQTFVLDDSGLTITLSCRNSSASRMPCGLGFHPYFPCDSATLLDTVVEGAWTVDDKVLPVERVSPEGAYDLRRRAICGQGLDNGFDGWGGAATLRYATHELIISSPTARRFQVYSPVTGGIVVAEPVENQNAALNLPQDEWAGAGITMLEHGQTASLSARFDVIQH